MFYEKNMQTLHEYREKLYQFVKKQETVISDILNIDSVVTRTDDLALVVEKDNHLFRLNSKYNPKEEASKWAEQYLIKNLDSVIVMFGLGNSIFVRELVNRLNDGNLIIVYEPSIEIFSYVLRNFDLEDILKDTRVCLVIQGVNEFEFRTLLYKTLSWKNLFSKVECLHPGYDKLFEDSFIDFKNAIKDNTFNNVVSKNTHEVKGSQNVENALNNLSYIKNSISVWDINNNLPKDLPAFVVAAGPSLNKNVDVLKQAKGKSIIFAVDRSYETLLAHNIEPDFIVTLDVHKKLKYCGNQIGFKVPLLCKIESSPDILKNHAGKKIIYNCDEFIVGIYKTLGKKFVNISEGASVATAAFSICANLGFKRIVFVGQDLAYFGDVAHAGVQTDNINSENRNIDLFVEDIFGKTVRTRHDWYAFLRSFENVIPQIPDTDFIDATEGGARIKGTRVMTLQDVVDHYCEKEFNCKYIIENQKSTFNKSDIKTIYDYLVISKNHLKDTKELSYQAINELCLYETKRKNDGQMLIKKIAKINKKIEVMPIYSLINQFVLGKGADEIESLYFITNDKKTDEESSIINAKAIFNNIIEACDFIGPLLNNAICDFIELKK